MLQRPTHNPQLPFIKSNWKGNQLNSRYQYLNLDGASEKGFKDVFKWQLSTNPLKPLKKGQRSPLKINFIPDFSQLPENSINWIGHATFVIKLKKCTLITDPVLFKVGPLKRYTPLPCPPEEFKGIDIILLSHNHRDHCDRKSLILLCKQNPNAVILTALGLKKLLLKWGIKNEIQEAGWYQTYQHKYAARITFLPAKHWNRRGLTDLNEMLWGSFMLEQNEKKIYFGADSGMGIHFKEIGKLFNHIDFALLGIGAYKPEWFMASSHTNPFEAIEAAKQLNAKCLLPMHYGTFDLADEPVFFPLEEIKKLKSDNSQFPEIQTPGIGEPIRINE